MPTTKGQLWQVELHVHLGKKLTQIERLGPRSVRLASPAEDSPYTRIVEIEQCVHRPYVRLDKAMLFAIAIGVGAEITLPCYIDWKGRECEARVVLKP